MSLWLACAIALTAGITLAALACLRGDRMAAVVALEVAGGVAALVLLILAAGFGRQAFADLGLVLAVLSFGGALSFLRFLERAR